MEVLCHSLNGEVALTRFQQHPEFVFLKTAYLLLLPKGLEQIFIMKKMGKNSPFDSPDADNIIELNGIKSELVIYTAEERG